MMNKPIDFSDHTVFEVTEKKVSWKRAPLDTNGLVVNGSRKTQRTTTSWEIPRTTIASGVQIGLPDKFVVQIAVRRLLLGQVASFSLFVRVVGSKAMSVRLYENDFWTEITDDQWHLLPPQTTVSCYHLVACHSGNESTRFDLGHIDVRGLAETLVQNNVPAAPTIPLPVA